jgi:hypothetical protein
MTAIACSLPDELPVVAPLSSVPSFNLGDLR